MEKNKLSIAVKMMRKKHHLMQENIFPKSWVGLCFIDSMENGTVLLCMEKVNRRLFALYVQSHKVTAV